MLKISNRSKLCECLDIRIEMNKTIITIQKAKEWGRTKRVILPKRINPFLKKYVVQVFI